jgi:hypothetical protein
VKPRGAAFVGTRSPCASWKILSATRAAIRQMVYLSVNTFLVIISVLCDRLYDLLRIFVGDGDEN